MLIFGDTGDGLQVAFAQFAGRILPQSFLQLRLDLFQRQESRDFALRFAGELRNLFLGHAVGIAERDEGIVQLIGVQVGTLPVLHKLVDDDRFAHHGEWLRDVIDDARDGRESCKLRRSEATLTADNLVNLVLGVVEDADGLAYSPLTDRCGEFLQLLLVKLTTRLFGVRADAREDNAKRSAQARAAFLFRVRSPFATQRQVDFAFERPRERLARCPLRVPQGVAGLRRRIGGRVRRWRYWGRAR